MGELPKVGSFIKNILPEAFLGSNSMAEHTVATRDFVARRRLKTWQRGTLHPSNGSNYLHYPQAYFFSELFGEEGNSMKNPHTVKHRELLKAEGSWYYNLEWQVFKYVLAGEGGFRRGLSRQAITDEEFLDEELPYYLYTGRKRGLLDFDDVDETTDRVITNQVGRVTPIRLGITLSNLGVLPDYSKFESLQKKAAFSARLRPSMVQAATLRLGAMIAMTDQMIFVMSGLGDPIPFNYTPPKWNNNLQASWDKKMGFPLTGLEDVYLRAHDLLTELTKPNHPLLGYLHTMRNLPFAR